jgi:hypothetical protein
MGPVLLYPFRPGLVRRRFVQVPDEPVAFVFAILRTTVPPADPAAQVAANRPLYERARAVGGTRYPVGSVPFRPLDWVAHYGRDYPAFAAAKATSTHAACSRPGRASSARRADPGPARRPGPGRRPWCAETRA